MKVNRTESINYKSEWRYMDKQFRDYSIIVENITLKALFLSLFITENCMSLDLTVSPNETLGAFFSFCNHGWSAFSEQATLPPSSHFHFATSKKNKIFYIILHFISLCILYEMHISIYIPNTSCAVRRHFGSGSSIFFTRSFALSETFGHGSLLKSTTDRIIAWATPFSVSAFKTQDLENQIHHRQNKK